MRPCNCHAVYERSRDLEERLAAAQSEIATLKRLLANRGNYPPQTHEWVRLEPEQGTRTRYACRNCRIVAIERYEVDPECGMSGMPGTRRRAVGGGRKRDSE